MEQVTVTKTIITRANQKPWLTKEVCNRLRERNAAFRAYLNQAIRVAKHAHSQKIQAVFQDPSSTRRLWQGIQTVTDYKATPTPCQYDIGFVNELNNFFGRFEALNSSPARKATPHPDKEALRLESLLCGEP